MQYRMTQAELRIAIQTYLNEHILKNPVEVKGVESQKGAQVAGKNYVLHIKCETIPLVDERKDRTDSAEIRKEYLRANKESPGGN